MNPQLLLFGALSGALGVALGAFGAHALRPRLEPERLVVFETAVRYQLIHALALLFCSTTVVAGGGTIWFTLCGWFFVFGSLLFSGSLYLLVFTNRRAWGGRCPTGRPGVDRRLAEPGSRRPVQYAGLRFVLRYTQNNRE